MFREDEIELAKELKAAGLVWNPQPGHYVWDETCLIEHDSPFHGRVFFILDLKHFLRRSKTIEALQKRLVWLPTWEQLRALIRQQQVSESDVAQHLNRTNAIATQTERLELYRLLLASLGR